MSESRAMTLEETEAEAEAQERAEYVAGLRALADAIEAEPGIPIDRPVTIEVYDWGGSKADFQESVRGLGGVRTKHVSDAYMRVSRSFGPHRVTVVGDRDEVCTAKVIGTEEIATKVRQGEDERPWVQVVETVDILAWDCEPVLGDSDV